MNPWFLILVLIVALVILACAHAKLRRHYQWLHTRQQCLSRRDVSQQEYYDSLNRFGFQSLQEYRGSELWLETKRRYRSSDYSQRCLICGSSVFDLHHRSYARLGEEELFDLVPLCRRHHDKLHELLDPNPDVCVKDTHDYLVFLMEDEEGPDTESEVAHLSEAASRVVDRLAARAEQRRESIAARVAPTSSEFVSSCPNWRELRPRAGRVWTPDEDAALLLEFDTGLPLEEIALLRGRGVFGVAVRLCKLGRKPPAPIPAEPIYSQCCQDSVPSEGGIPITVERPGGDSV